MMSIFLGQSERGSGSEICHCTESTTRDYYSVATPIQQCLWHEKNSVVVVYRIKREYQSYERDVFKHPQTKRLYCEAEIRVRYPVVYYGRVYYDIMT